jgi:hypothetical protein
MTQTPSYRRKWKDFKLPCLIFVDTQTEESSQRKEPERKSTRNSDKVTPLAKSRD